MQTQSTWRRDHYLFDVHSSAWDAQEGTNIILQKNDKNPSICNASTTVFDHGLIYHHHANDEKRPNLAEELLHRANRPKVKYHCSLDCDAVGSSIIFCQPQINTTFIEDPFRLAAAQREANKRACSTSSASSYLMENDTSKRRKTTAGAP